MLITKIACPHCKAILKSKKTVPVGKRITCVQCKQPFFFANDMLASSAGDTHDDSAFSLAETQAGTLPSPIAGVTLPVSSSAVSTIEMPAHTPSRPKPMPVETDPEEMPISRGRHTSWTPIWAALIFFVLFVLGVAGAGLGYFLYGRTPAATPVVNNTKSPAEVKPTEPTTIVPDNGSKPKNVVPIVPAPVKPKIDDKLKARIDFATRKGVSYLKQTIQPNGTWKEGGKMNAPGFAALPGLAMLECGVPANDPVIQQAAAYVRAEAPDMKETYDIGTVILFLDTLGDPADKKLIHNLALRLMAGQTSAGGWTYHCPILNEQENQQFAEFLNAQKPDVKLLIPLPTFIEDDGKKGPLNNKFKPKENINEPLKKAPPAALPPNVAKLPIVANQLKKRGYQPGATDDNSNTHFALLGLWAARRHNTPVELSLELVGERFQKTQAKDGGWGYVVNAPPKNTMTCVGLIALAMGHGAAAELVAEAAAKNKTLPKALAKDPAIQDAIKGIGQYLDGDESLKGLEARIDLYYLWSLERVGMLYRQKHFGKTDWFDYGAKQVLERQFDDGRWAVHYDAPVDTAFALLFLNRSDLVEDLTHNLHSYLAVPNATPRTHTRPEELRPRERERPKGHTMP